MAIQNKDGTGVLFQSKEQKTDKHPTHSGTLQIDGKEVKLVGWRQMSKGGIPYISLKFGDHDKGTDTKKPTDDESIPF